MKEQPNKFKSLPRRTLKMCDKLIKSSVCTSNSSGKKNFEKQNNVGESNTSDLGFRCLKEACILLDYSPESLFLKRIKQRMESLQDKNEVNNSSSLVLENLTNVPMEAPKSFCVFSEEERKLCKRKNDIRSKEIKQEKFLINNCEIVNDKKDKIYGFARRGRSVEKKKKESKLQLKRSCSNLPIKYNSHSKTDFSFRRQTEKKYSKKMVRTQNNAAQTTGRCCKNQVDAGCCSAGAPRREACVQVPEVHSSCTPAAPGEPPTEGGLEALGRFRRANWFDTHAHLQPSALAANRLCHQLQAADTQLVSLSLDPCVRSYRLNNRLFPAEVWESHGSSCCLGGVRGEVQGGPSERAGGWRTVTLPALSPRLTCSARDTLGTAGMRACAPSHPLPSAPPPAPPAPSAPSAPPAPSAPAVPRARRPPVPPPSNSLALRFQKGVYK